MHAVKSIFIGLLLSFTLFVAPISIFAQTPPKGIETCFAYYDYGKVQTHISADKPDYQTGQTVKLLGQIINRNTFPLVNVVLYAQVRRINDKSYGQNGHHLVDRLLLKEGINLMPQEAKNLDLILPLKTIYPKGSYQIQYYIFSKNGFHYGGRSFLEEDFAGTTNFTVSGGKEPEVYLDIDNIRVNGTTHQLRGLTAEFPKGPVSFDFSTVDTRKEKGEIPASIKIYSFEDDLEDKLIAKTSSNIKDGALHFDFNPPEQGAYVIIVQIDSPVQSILKYRFASVFDIASELRMNDIGVSQFPAKPNGRAWVCFHSPTFEMSPRTTVSLSLLNSSKKVIDQVSLTDSFSPDVNAISIPLAKLTTPNDFWVLAQFINPEDTKHSRSVEIHYQCELFTASLREISIIYNQNTSNVVRLEGINTCGKPIREAKINNIRLSKDGTVQKEATNILELPYDLSLEGLSAGIYKMEIRAGAIIKEQSITITDQSKKITPDSQNINKYIFYVLAGIIILAIVIAIYRRIRK